MSDDVRSAMNSDKLSARDKRILARYVCGWCDQPLDKQSCGALFGPCSQGTMESRRKECLEAHKEAVSQARKALLARDGSEVEL